MTRFLFDTAVFVYARGAEHEYRAPCRRLVELVRDGAVAGEASVELVQEFVHLLRRGRVSGAVVQEQARAVAGLCLLHPFDEPELRLALNLVATTEGLGIRDAVHAATAPRRGVGLIVSPDRVFDRITGLERLDPHDAPGRLVG